MAPKIKNIIIFLAIGGVFVLAYIFFIKPKPPVASLVSSSSSPLTSQALPKADDLSITQDFLNVLLSVKNIKLNDAIFSDNTFISLHDSSIVLVPDGNEGRLNPFAPIGTDASTATPLTCVSPKVLNTSTNTCVNPPAN